MTAPDGLRFGIMCGGTHFPDWQAASIRALLELPGVRPALLIVDGEPAPPKRSLGARLGELAPGGAFLWNAFYRGSVQREPRIDLARELDGVPQMRVVAERRGRFSQYFAAEDVAAIRSAKLDFILRYGFDIIRGEILDAARYGVWSFHHADIDRYRGMPAAFWELYRGDPVVGATLQRLTDRLDGGRVLKRGWFGTVPKSYRRTRCATMLGSASFPADVCRDILAGRASCLDDPPHTTDAPLYRRPTNLQMLRFLAGRAWHRALDPLRWLFVHEQWDVGRIRRPIETLLDDPRPEIEWLRICRRNRFIADPFARHADGRLDLLFEDFTYEEGRGVISALEWPDDGPPGPVRRVYTTSGHLSYPYLLEHDGTWYCLPEMGDTERVLLLRADPFPQRWVEVATLISGVSALDPTLFPHEGRWWLLLTTKRGERGLDLHAYHADTIEGPYTPHLGNPLKVDVRSARPAGTPFRVGERLIRPAQDCAATYGGRIALNEIETLTPEAFSERTVTFIEPDPHGPYPHGTHTLSAAGPFTVIDGKRRLFSPHAFRTELARLARRMFGRGRRQARATRPAEDVPR